MASISNWRRNTSRYMPTVADCNLEFGNNDEGELEIKVVKQDPTFGRHYNNPTRIESDGTISCELRLGPEEVERLLDTITERGAP